MGLDIEVKDEVRGVAHLAVDSVQYGVARERIHVGVAAESYSAVFLLGVKPLSVGLLECREMRSADELA